MIKTECNCIPKIHMAHFKSVNTFVGGESGGLKYTYSDLIEMSNGFEKPKVKIQHSPESIAKMEELTKFYNAKCECSELIDCKKGKCSCLSKKIKEKLPNTQIGKELQSLEELHTSGEIPDADYYKERFERFKPIGPKESDEWLNNFNITAIMKQWMLKFPEFYSWGFSMDDFSEVKFGLGFPSLKKLTNYKKFGCVVNTDTSKHRGEHWFAIFIDTTSTPPTVEYFDSANREPSINITKFMKESADYINGIVVKVAKIQHQKSRSECGVYSLIYIHSRLNGVPYQEFSNKRISDDVVSAFRLMFN